MKVSFHSSTINRAIGGALYYYGEISLLLSQQEEPELTSLPHDIFKVVAGDESVQRAFVSSLNRDDVVVSAIGPYAYIYFYLRERYGGRYRIIRDVRTTSWAGFLLQEQLVAPLLHENDVILCPSEFARQYFIHRFTGLTKENTRVSYPLSSSFPEVVGKTQSNNLRIGYIGRISENKNLTQVLSIFKAARYRYKEKVSLHLAGQVSLKSKRFLSRNILIDYLKVQGVDPSDVTYYGYLTYNDIWQFYGNIDVLLFPSMANVESLGRVLLEASRARVPVVASNYAACPELLSDDRIARTSYTINKKFDAIGSFSFGVISEEDAIERMFARDAGEDASRREVYQKAQFFRYIKGDFGAGTSAAPLNDVVKAFLRSVILSNVTRLSFAESMKTIEVLFTFYTTYNNNNVWQRLSLLKNVVNRVNIDSDATHLYLDRVLRPSNRMVLRHARQFCQQAQYLPQISLKPNKDDSRLLAPTL